ncbi:MAG: ClpXP protease specificity-enhancing factor [Zoogloeaceae bacterium]|jgi:stringent starvation protein B|nr:ClpXP protease specificity-enhancing factor [Zoogloeaceae bacterium]
MNFSQPVSGLPSTKPYLLRAVWEWCNDNGFTPYLVVEVDASCRVPVEFVQDGQIVLNISMEATHNLQIANDLISFQGRFADVARELIIPTERVSAIYARENGAGMAFEISAATTSPHPEARAATPPASHPEDPPPPDTPGGGRSHLRRIK